MAFFASLAFFVGFRVELIVAVGRIDILIIAAIDIELFAFDGSDAAAGLGIDIGDCRYLFFLFLFGWSVDKIRKTKVTDSSSI